MAAVHSKADEARRTSALDRFTSPGPRDKIYSAAKVATIVAALIEAGVPAREALRNLRLSHSALSLPATRVSLDQIVEACRNGCRLAADPYFAYRTGQRFRVSTFGLYGFAILSATHLREAIRFALEYIQLGAPLVDVTFAEQGGSGVWTATPVPHPRIDASLFRFVVELEFGIITSLHRDVIGPSFVPAEIRLTYAPPARAGTYREVYGCPVLFEQAENRLIVDAKWLDCTPQLGNELTYRELTALCEDLLEAMALQAGVAGRVRGILLANLMRPIGFERIASDLHMTARTLRRRLADEGTTFRQLANELKMDLAVKYLRDTGLTIEQTAHAVGFAEVASFRHAFRRRTGTSPLEYRKAFSPARSTRARG